MSSYIDHPAVWLSLGALFLAGSSLCWAYLARHLLTTLPHQSGSRQILAGLTVSVPVIGLALCLTTWEQTFGATTAGSGAALTYILIVPAIVFGKPLASGAWPIWHRAVLPFCLATAAMWVIIGSTGHFWPLDGQFLITLFALGTWLFTVESKAARGTLDSAPDAPVPDNAERDSIGPAPGPANPSPQPGPAPASMAFLPGEKLAVAESAAAPGLPAATNRLRAVLVVVAAAGLTILAMPLLTTGQPYWAVYLAPLLGVLTCAGPLLVTARGTAAERSDWAVALGYAAMAAACLVPGLAGFLQPSLGAPPLYGPDGAFLGLAAGLLLAFGQDGLTRSRTARRLLAATWGIWLAWILLSVLLARHPVAQPLLPDPSVWNPS